MVFLIIFNWYFGHVSSSTTRDTESRTRQCTHKHLPPNVYFISWVRLDRFWRKQGDTTLATLSTPTIYVCTWYSTGHVIVTVYHYLRRADVVMSTHVVWLLNCASINQAVYRVALDLRSMEASDALNHVCNRTNYSRDKLTEDSPLSIAHGYRRDGWYSCCFDVCNVNFGTNVYPLMVVATLWRWARLGTRSLTKAQPKCRLWLYFSWSAYDIHKKNHICMFAWTSAYQEAPMRACKNGALVSAASTARILVDFFLPWTLIFSRTLWN